MTSTQTSFIASVKALCKKHYNEGGDMIIECFTDEEIIQDFHSLEGVREYCGLKIEQALNARWGEDNDQELETYKRFQQNWK